MTELYAIILFITVLLFLLGTGVWVGLALMGVAWFGMELFTTCLLYTSPSPRDRG